MQHTSNYSELTSIQKLLPRDKNIMTTKEVSQCIGKSTQFVRNAIKQGNLVAFILQGRSLGKTQQRKSYLIPNDAVVSFLLNYEKTRTHNRIGNIMDSIQKCSKEQLKCFQEIIEEMMKSKSHYNN